METNRSPRQKTVQWPVSQSFQNPAFTLVGLLSKKLCCHKAVLHDPIYQKLVCILLSTVGATTIEIFHTGDYDNEGGNSISAWYLFIE